MPRRKRPMKNTRRLTSTLLVTVLGTLFAVSAHAQVRPEHAGTYDFVFGEKQGPCAGQFGLGILTVTRNGQVTGSYRNQATGETGTFRGTVNARGEAVLQAGNSRIQVKLRGRNVVLVDGDYVSGASRGFVAGVRK